MVAITSRPEGQLGASSTVEIIEGDAIDEFLAPFGGREAFFESERQHQANRKYLQAHYQELKKQYPDQWVGIARQQVRAHGETADEVIDALEEAGENLDDVLLHRAWVEEPHWIL